MLGRTIPGPVCKWLRHFNANAAFHSTPLNKVLVLLLGKRKYFEPPYQIKKWSLRTPTPPLHPQTAKRKHPQLAKNYAIWILFNRQHRAVHLTHFQCLPVHRNLRDRNDTSANKPKCVSWCTDANRKLTCCSSRSLSLPRTAHLRFKCGSHLNPRRSAA